MMRLRGSLPFPDLTGRRVFLVDDGLAFGFTMRTAIELVCRLGPAFVMAAVPTGHSKAVVDIAGAWIGFTAQTSGAAWALPSRMPT